MNENEFILQLRKYLINIPEMEKEEILEEYRSHFASGRKNGMFDEEISDRLGHPRLIASEYIAYSVIYGDKKVEKAEKVEQTERVVKVRTEKREKQKGSSSVRLVARLMSLGFLWICLLMPLGISLIATFGALGIAGVSLTIYSIISMVLAAIPAAGYITTFSPEATYLILTGGVFFGIGLGYIFSKLTWRASKIFYMISVVSFRGSRKNKEN